MLYPIGQLRVSEFPGLLHEIPDKPKRLYVRGTLPPKNTTYLCVVGSRRTTAYGQRMAHQLIAGLARSPVAIVSGMAMGIDSEAHKAALDVGLPTVAVLPSGLDDRVLYPSVNRPLAKRILALGSALLSENEPEFVAMLHSFPERNRICAGISKATLIVEAGEKSGTLITARLALDYNREVMGIPHELGRETGMGVNRLLREGATLVRDSDDILQVLGLKPSDKPQQTMFPIDLTTSEVAILETLPPVGGLARDELVALADLSAQEANIALSSLLIRGLILERLGKIERI